MTNEKINVNEVEQDIETVEINEEVETEDIVVDEPKSKKFFGSLKAKAGQHKKKIIGVGLATAAIAVAAYKIATSKDESCIEDDDYGIDVEVEVEPEVSEVE